MGGGAFRGGRRLSCGRDSSRLIESPLASMGGASLGGGPFPHPPGLDISSTGVFGHVAGLWSCPDTSRMDHELTAAAVFKAAPYGLRTKVELAAAGLGPAAVASMVRRGTLTRVTAGYFALGAPTPAPVDRLVRLGRALEGRYGGRAVISHHVALAAAGLPLFELPLDSAHLTYRRGGCYRARRDHVVHAAPVGADIVTTEALPIAEALVQCLAMSGEKAFVVAGDAALRRGLATREVLAALADQRRHAKYHALLSRAVARLDGRSESPGESLTRLAVSDLGHCLTSQVDVVANGRHYRLDLVIEGTRVAIEFDGVGKYGTTADLRAEKAREEDLRVAGWIVVRFQWGDLFRPEELKRRIDWGLAMDRRMRAVGC